MWGSGWYYPPYYYGGFYYRYYPTFRYGARYNPWTGTYGRGDQWAKTSRATRRQLDRDRAARAEGATQTSA